MSSADTDPDDATAESAPAVADGKADSATALFGNYDLNGILNGSPENADGDIVSLTLFEQLDGSRSSPPSNTAGSYVRVRAYGDHARLVAQTDTFRLFTSSGKTYIEFRGFEWTNFAQGDSKPVVEDIYEYKNSHGALTLRKAHTTRWQSFASVTDETLCHNSSGTWDPAHPAPAARSAETTPCNCPSGQTFVPGAGGCTSPLDPAETLCDNTKGSYTDDDSTLLGTFCVCPTGDRLTANGCAAI